jgi:hypothetical protein
MDFVERPTGTGGAVLPETDPDKRALAEHVGFVVMMAAQLDVTLSVLVDLATGYDDELKMEAWGRSGTDLVKRLRGIEEAFPETAGFADRYDRLYKTRNQVVHSTRMDGNPDADPNVTLRLVRQDPKKPAPGIYEGLVLGIPQLIDLWYGLRDFNHEVMHVFLDYASRSKWAPTWVPYNPNPDE